MVVGSYTDSDPEKGGVQSQETLLQSKGEAGYLFCLLARSCKLCTGQLGCECETSDTNKKENYYEALDMLYQRTTFAARRTHAVRELPQMLPATWHRVRALHLSTAFQYPITTTIQSQLRPPLDEFAQWGQTCRRLATPKLFSLDITIALWPLNPSRRDTPIDFDSLALLLDPLRTVQADKFTVTLTSNVPPDAKRKLPDFPFELQVRVRSGIGYYTVASDD